MRRSAEHPEMQLGLLAMAVAVAGCAVDGPTPRRWVELAHFPHRDASPRVVVYGSLLDLLPQYDATPALERWLYGPSNFGVPVLRNPQGMALLGNQLLVCDQGQPDITAINPATGRALPWSPIEHPPNCPVDVATDDHSHVYVADTTRRSVLHYAPNGTLLDELKPPSDPDATFRPCAVYVMDGTLYIGDLGRRHIARWQPGAQRWLEPWKTPKTMKGLIAPTGITSTPDGVLLIADSVQAMIFRVTTEGEWLEPFGGPGRGPGQFVRPKQICTTPSGWIFVADAGRQSVVVLDRDGRYVLEIGERPNGWHGWTLPTGLLAVETIDRLIGPGGIDLDDGVRPNAWVLVSDALGAPSLTLLGIVEETGSRNANEG